MNVLIPAMAVVIAALIGGAVTLVGAFWQLRSKPSRDDERRRSMETRIAELEEDGLKAYHHNEELERELRACREENRRLDQALYEEKVGRAIANRKLAEALEALERLTDE